jgi:hypothetical protein
MQAVKTILALLVLQAAGLAQNPVHIVPPAAPEAQPKATQGARAEASFRQCDQDSFLALNMARNYLLSGRKKESVLAYVGNDAVLKALAEQMFARIDSGEFKHHSEYAAEILLHCASSTGHAIDKPRNIISFAFARVDIPFFLVAAKARGLKQDEAVASTAESLTNRSLYPLSLIHGIATMVYSNRTEADDVRLMHTIFWGAVFSEEWSKR